MWATTYVNLGSACRKTGRLAEAKQHYLKVLEIDPRHAPALAFLGMVHHLMDQADLAIIRYHEALSIDPLNPHTLELLNLALEVISEAPPFGGSIPGGEEVWQKMMVEHAEAAAKKKTQREKEKEVRGTGAGAHSIERTSGSGAVQDVAMSDA